MRKIFTSKGLQFLCLTFLLLSVSCGGNKKQREERVIPVKTLNVGLTTQAATQNYVGNIEEESSAGISFMVAGTVLNIPVKEGDAVRKGALLAQVSTENLQSSYDASMATLSQAEDAMARMQILYDNNSLPEIKYIEVKTKLEKAKSMAQISAKNLADSKIYAPYDGIIGKRNVELGENVIPGRPIMTLLRVNQVKVKFSVSEHEIANIDKRGEAKIIVPALGNKEYNGKITEKNIIANNLARTYDAKIILDNKSGELIPGMVCRLIVPNGSSSDPVFVLPNNVVQIAIDGRRFVWLMENDKAVARNVEVGSLADTGVVIERGLSDSDRVIVEGYHKISEGMKVREK